MISHILIWESKEDYDANLNWNGIGIPKQPKFRFTYKNFTWMEKFITHHNQFWEIWELFQLAAECSRLLENEEWNGKIHPEHDNLKLYEKESWQMTEIPIGGNYMAVCYLTEEE